MSHCFDVLVVGGSLAGASLAQRLAQENISVAIIDKAEFPRRKACGEGLSAISVRLLQECGIDLESSSLNIAKLQGYRIQRQQAFTDIPVCGGDHHGAAFGCRRSELDAAVLHQAKARGVSCFLGSNVRTVTKRKDRVLVQIEDKTLTGRYLVLADGSNSFLANQLRIESKPASNSRFAFSSIFKGAADPTRNKVQIILKPGFQICCTPVATDTLNVSVLARGDLLRFFSGKGGLQQLQEILRHEIQFEGEPQFGLDAPLGAGPLKRRKRGGYGHGVFLVGDCCETLDPIGGMGMTHALMSSKLAAQALQRIILDALPEKLAGQWYEQAREQEMRSMRGFTRLTYFYLRTLAARKYVDVFANSPLLSHVSFAAHKNRGPSSMLSVCSNLLLTLSGI